MWRRLTLSLACSLAVTPQPAFAQDNDAAAERARLASQRILAESERRARELEQLERIDAETLPPPTVEAADSRATVQDQAEIQASTGRPPPAETPAGSPHTGAERAGAAELSETLEQLRTLGELWDAGYVSDEEFERIKGRILGSEP